MVRASLSHPVVRARREASPSRVQRPSRSVGTTRRGPCAFPCRAPPAATNSAGDFALSPGSCTHSFHAHLTYEEADLSDEGEAGCPPLDQMIVCGSDHELVGERPGATFSVAPRLVSSTDSSISRMVSAPLTPHVTVGWDRGVARMDRWPLQPRQPLGIIGRRSNAVQSSLGFLSGRQQVRPSRD